MKNSAKLLLFGQRAFTPKSLFAISDVGGWYDPSDLTTLWQDTAGTTPVTADGDAVARIDDKSGRGNHLVQATGLSQPLYKTSGGLHWLQFDGSNDGMATSSTVDFTGTDEVSLCIGIRKSSDAAGAGTVVELSADIGANAGTFLLRAPRTATSDFGWFSKGTLLGDNAIPGYAAPISAVVTAFGKISTDNIGARVNGVLDTDTDDQGTGNYGNYTLYVGRRGGTTLPFNGNIYSLVIRNRLFNSAEIASIERYAAAKTGVTF